MCRFSTKNMHFLNSIFKSARNWAEKRDFHRFFIKHLKLPTLSRNTLVHVGTRFGKNEISSSRTNIALWFMCFRFRMKLFPWTLFKDFSMYKFWLTSVWNFEKYAWFGVIYSLKYVYNDYLSWDCQNFCLLTSRGVKLVFCIHNTHIWDT